MHFLAIGVALFAVSAWRGESVSTGRDAIVVTAEQVAQARAAAAVLQGREPTPEELDALIEPTIRDEVLYREALALGLDENDDEVRTRLIEKMNYLTQDLADPEPSSAEALRQFYDASPALFTIPSLVSFDQVFFSPGMRGDRLEADATAGLAALRAGRAPADVGDRTPLRESYDDAPREQVAVLFGDALADALFGAAPGEWTGPFRSDFGLHAVRLAQPQRSPVAAVRRDRRTRRRGIRRAAAARGERARVSGNARALRRRHRAAGGTRPRRRSRRSDARGALHRAARCGTVRAARARASLEPRVLRPHRDRAERLRGAVEGVDLGRLRGRARAAGAGRLLAGARRTHLRSRRRALCSTRRSSARTGSPGKRSRSNGLAQTQTDVLLRVDYLERQLVESAADARRAVHRHPGAAEHVRGRAHLSRARRRAHPARHRSLAVRARVAAARERRRPPRGDRDGVHGRAQHHARRGDARVRPRAFGARRSRHRAQHPVPRVGARTAAHRLPTAPTPRRRT